MESIKHRSELPSVHPPSSLLNRYWRLVATAFCFILFGLGGLMMSTFWFSFLRLAISDQAKCNQLTQNSIRHSFRFFMATTQLLGVLEYHIHGAELFKQDRGCLVVANHPSLLDYVLLASSMPRCDCIVKESLLHNFFMRGVIKSAGYLANTDSDRLLAQCQNKLDQGGTILIFPEGTRSTPKQKIHLQRGAANIALRCSANIRVVYIHCDQPILTKQEKWYKIPPAKPVFNIRVQEKIVVQNIIDSETSLAIAARHLTDRLRQQLTPGTELTSETRVMVELQNEIKALIIEALNLEDINIDDIDTQAPLFNEGLGLDSIDALELGLALKNRYSVILSAESDDTHKHFYSVQTLANFVFSQRG